MTDTINRSQAAYLHRSAAWLAGGFAEWLWCLECWGSTA
jgi:hypothetical protein